MAKLLFINPVVREEDEPRHVPYGMALLAAIVMRQGHSVQVFDDRIDEQPIHKRQRSLLHILVA